MMMSSMAPAPVFRADAEMAALHLARVFDGRDPDDRRSGQWQTRIRVWAHRYPTRVYRYGHIGRRTQYDLGQLEDLAGELLFSASGRAA